MKGDTILAEFALISVIVPVYGAEKHLFDCVESILQQTHKNLELILVDDDSPDDSGKLCDHYANKDERVTVIHQKNLGTSGARNAGLEIAKGEYIVFLDCDDFAHNRILEHLLSICTENDVKMAVTSFEEIEADATLLEKFAIPKRKPLEVIDPITYIARLCTIHQVLYVVPWAKIYHKSVYDGVRFPLGALNEDDCVIDELLYKAQRIAVEYVPLVYYRKNPNSQSRVGMSAQQWLASVPYKQKRMERLQAQQQFDLLYKVQRLFFYDLLLEREKQPRKEYARVEFLKLARKLYKEIAKNPKRSKKEVLSMFKLTMFPSLIKKHEHNEFLIQGGAPVEG